MSETTKVEVIARPERGFYRAGLKFTKEPRVLEVVKKVENPEKQITEKTLEVLEAESNLVVRPAREEEKTEGKKTEGKKTEGKK